jgi:hypothetical protein
MSQKMKNNSTKLYFILLLILLLLAILSLFFDVRYVSLIVLILGIVELIRAKTKYQETKSKDDINAIIRWGIVTVIGLFLVIDDSIWLYKLLAK